jgi:hypothetical protein
MRRPLEGGVADESCHGGGGGGVFSGGGLRRGDGVAPSPALAFGVSALRGESLTSTVGDCTFRSRSAFAIDDAEDIEVLERQAAGEPSSNATDTFCGVYFLIVPRLPVCVRPVTTTGEPTGSSGDAMASADGAVADGLALRVPKEAGPPGEIEEVVALRCTLSHSIAFEFEKRAPMPPRKETTGASERHPSGGRSCAGVAFGTLRPLGPGGRPPRPRLYVKLLRP